MYPDFKIAKSLIFFERFLSLDALAKYSNAKTLFPSLIAIFDKLNKERPEYPLDSFTKEAIYSSPREIYFNRAGDRYLLGDLKGAREDWKKAAELGDEDAVKLLEEHCG